MHALRSVLKQAQQMRVAVGHFNVVDLVLLKAVFVSAQELKVPVLVGVSEGEREFMGVPQIAVLVRQTLSDASLQHARAIVQSSWARTILRHCGR
jgi:fructose/tagatose bisphosphate aldolase